MSGPGSDAAGAPERRAYQRLQRAVDRLLQHDDQRAVELAESRARIGELEGLLRRLDEDPGEVERMNRRVVELTEENRDMRERLTQGRDTVERLLARIRYLEEQR